MGRDNRITAAAGRGVTALLLCALLAAALPFAALAEDGDEAPQGGEGNVVHRDGDVVYTAQGWEDWLAEYEFQKPGTMVLGADITLVPELNSGINGTSGTKTDIVVQTGDYGITVQQRSLGIGLQVQIVGTGQRVPVITVAEGGSLILGGSDGTNGVTATGDGGCAIDVKAGGGLFSSLGNFTAVTASGQNATALRMDGNLDIAGLIARAPGDGSVAVSCTGAVELSHSLAVGGLASVQAQSVVADISTLRPLPENGDITLRTISAVTDDYFESPVGAPLPSYFHADATSRYTCVLEGTRITPAGSEAVASTRTTAWFGYHPDDVAAIDTSTPGLYPLRLIPVDGCALLDLMPEEPLTTYYRVYSNSDLPTYSRLESNMDYLIAVYKFYCDYDMADTLEDEFTLWRKDGEDGEWYADDSYLAMEFNTVELAVVFYCPDLSPITQLVLEREGYGQTKILRITIDGETTIGTTGGDKDGGDADGEEPPDIEQPVLPGPGSSSSSSSSGSPSGSDSSSSSGGSSGSIGSSSSGGTGHSSGTGSSSRPAGSSSSSCSGSAASASSSGGGSSPDSDGSPGDSGNTGGGVVPDGTSRGSRPTGAILPTALQTGGEARTAVTERVTATETTVGGRRLADMMAIQGESVLFQKDSISLAVPSALLAALNVGENDALTVRLEALDGGAWRVDVAVNGQSLESLPGCWVTAAFPFPEDAALLTVKDPEGQEVAAEYDDEAGTVRFLAETPGLYTLDVQAIPMAQPNAGPADAAVEAPKGGDLAAGLPVGAAVCLLAAGGLVFTLHRRRSRA